MKNHKNKPPTFANRFLNWFIRDDLAEEVQGDLEEQFQDNLERNSPFRAKLNYWYQVINYFRPFAIRKLTTTIQNINYTFMVRHNFIVSFRYFQRNKITFFINMLGLPAGIACVLLIWLWVNDELKIDQFHKYGDRIYQVMENHVQNGKTITSQSTRGPISALLAAEYPEVEYAVTTTWSGGLDHYVLTFNEKDVVAEGIYADSGFFKIFTFDIILGNRDKLLSDKSNIVISESLSRNLFGESAGALGKILQFQHGQQFIVSGVLKDVPSISSFQFDFVLPFAHYRDENKAVTHWYNSAPRTFLLMKPGTDIEIFNGKIKNLIRDNTGGDVDYVTPFATLYSRTYLHNNFVNGKEVGGRIEYIKLFSLIAIFILLIACINFMNLSTARASTRMKEIGIKKTIGAGRSALVFQYLGESLIFSFISMVVAVVAVYLLLPQFNLITGKHLSLKPDIGLIVHGLLISVITGFISGSYPALYLSAFTPVNILKRKIRSATGEVWVRKSLVVFQFIISIILIVSVLVVYEQIEYIQTKNLGYDRENLLVFRRKGELEKSVKLESFLNEIKNLPGVKGASSIGHNLAGHKVSTYGIEWPGKDPLDKTEFEGFPVNYGLIELLGVGFMEGRSFSMDFASDSSSGIIFNEAAIEFMGLKDPVGKKVKLWGREREITGVVKNFHFESLKQELKPVYFWISRGLASNVMVKIEAGKQKETISGLQKIHAEINPGLPFDYRFQNEDYMKLYTAEQKVSLLSKYFAGLAILISCLGLFGMAAFTAERRTREIGIRKVFGAGVLRIVRLLSGDFTMMVIAAILVAMPVSFLITRHWLNGFVYHIKLSPWFFILTGILVLLIAWFTVGFQTWKAARVNPARSLKDE
jgi:putative ABC transport system permease protein